MAGESEADIKRRIEEIDLRTKEQSDPDDDAIVKEVCQAPFVKLT